MSFPAQEVLDSAQKRLFWQHIKIQLSSIPGFQEGAKVLGAFLGSKLQADTLSGSTQRKALHPVLG